MKEKICLRKYLQNNTNNISLRTLIKSLLLIPLELKKERHSQFNLNKDSNLTANNTFRIKMIILSEKGLLTNFKKREIKSFKTRGKITIIMETKMVIMLEPFKWTVSRIVKTIIKTLETKEGNSSSIYKVDQ